MNFRRNNQEVKSLGGGIWLYFLSLRSIFILSPSPLKILTRFWVFKAGKHRKSMTRFDFFLHMSSVVSKQPFRAAISFNFYPNFWSLVSTKPVMGSEEQISKGSFWGAFLFQKCCQLALGAGNEQRPGECCVWGRSGWALKKWKQAEIKISSKKLNSPGAGLWVSQNLRS